jgi:hypothetical protein
MNKNPSKDPNIAQAIKILELVVVNTTCPDPGEGGCIGGPIPGYGCVHEAARSALRRLEEATSCAT